MINRIIFGTAKMGLTNYGFSSCKVHLTSGNILQAVEDQSIRILDTSPRYGNAETLIGEYFVKNGKKFRICTKVDSLTANDSATKNKIYSSVIESIRKTNIDSIETLYLHQNNLAIISDERIMSSLNKVKDDGLVNKVGVSVYSKEECEFALNSSVYDVIQLPISIMDSNVYSCLIEGGVEKEIVARSIFLQGTLLNRGNIKRNIKQADSMLKYFSMIDGLAKEYGIDLLTLACSFMMLLPNINKIIISTGSRENLLKIVKSCEVNIKHDLYADVKSLSDKYKNWGNPKNWGN